MELFSLRILHLILLKVFEDFSFVNKVKGKYKSQKAMAIQSTKDREWQRENEILL